MYANSLMLCFLIFYKFFEILLSVWRNLDTQKRANLRFFREPSKELAEPRMKNIPVTHLYLSASSIALTFAVMSPKTPLQCSLDWFYVESTCRDIPVLAFTTRKKAQIRIKTTKSQNKVVLSLLWGGNNVDKKIWTNVGKGDKHRQGPQCQVLVLQVLYKHQWGYRCLAYQTPLPRVT